MTKQQAVRPAGLAIAAFLASVSPAALAQTVPPPDAPAPVTVTPPAFLGGAKVAPAAPTTAAPVFAPNQPVVQATPSVEERRAAAVAAAEAESSARSDAARPAPAAARATAARAAPVRQETVRQETPVAPRAESTPVASPRAAVDTAPAAATSAPAASTAPAPVAAAPADDASQPLLWALAGGALLFLGIGASAVLRRRRRSEGATPYGQEHGETIVADTRRSPAPVMAAAPAAAVREPVAYEPAAYEPAMRAPAATMAAPVAVSTASGSTLDAMVAAPPSRENPFRTKAKRTRRARFLLAREEAAALAPERAHAKPPQTIAAEDRSQTVYSFGKQGQRLGVFKPRNA